jgi:hypothetical protein
MVMTVGIYISCTGYEENNDALVDVDDFGLLFHVES